MSRFSSLRVRLVGIVFLAVAASLGLLYVIGFWSATWVPFAAGLVALGAAWAGGELFVMRQVRALLKAVKGFAGGDMACRTGLVKERGELGELARAFDSLAEALEKQIEQRERSQQALRREVWERERSEKALLNRAHQQTVVAALGQFAMVTPDLSTLLNHAVTLIGQTLEVEYCNILELQDDGKHFLVRAGVGWMEGYVGKSLIGAGQESQAGFTVVSGEPVVVTDLRLENRFKIPDMIQEHGVVSSVTVTVQGHNRPFGVLGIYTTRTRIFEEEEVHFLLAVTTVLAMAIDRQRTEPEIQKLAAFAMFNPNPVLEFASDGRLTFFNDAAEKMARSLGSAHPDAILPPEASNIVETCLATGRDRLHLETRTGKRVLTWSFYPIMASGVVHCYVEDITDRTSLEDQLRQAQKMESVGQLAAGVAHDFNNILTIIQGHSGLLMSRPNLTPAMTTSIQAVSFAAERASSLTRQLLMFSRKQVMQPRVLDLKEIITNMSKMLQRLLGETITFSCKSAPQLPMVHGDAGMVEQVLMNLAVNARDAMTKGGELTVRTESVQIDEAYAKSQPEARPGTFVCLQVADTGTGMDYATMRRIFEPFFTTKEAGKGTGLGLATVYGIVKQHSGWIEVASEIGKGTTFKIFFPASNKTAAESSEIPATAKTVRGGHETILVVEDEPVLRDLAQLILQDCGYRVLDASSGVEALTVWQRHQGAIDLLLTDMIMPDGLSGKDLAESLLANKPKLKVIFTSGYNVDEINADVGTTAGTKFLQKPYSRSTLALAVRECLDTDTAAAS
ncbi:MAG TPA: ATP-binding protein [Verrucomicrobiae bacterium]|nr:ATP-binding protein [Verrucomicrobiae bacterium]